MNKFLRAAVLALVFVGLFSGTASALNTYWNEADTKDVWLTENSETKVYRTNAETVGGFLQMEGIVVGENDILDFKLDTALKGEYVNELTIIRSINVTVYVDKVPQQMNLKAGSKVGNAIGKLPKVEGLEYYYDGKLTEPLADGGIIKIRTEKVEKTIDETFEEIPFDTEYIETEALEKGIEEVAQEGIVGEKKFITETTFVNGLEVTKEVSEEIVSYPLNKIVNVGIREKIVEPTPEPTPEPKKVVTKAPVSQPVVDEQGRTKYVMVATAYTSDYRSTGKNPGDPGFGVTASGMKAQVGVVAVDPGVIPLGTKMYIEGYGEAVAGDTGSSINGNKVDVYFDTNEECVQWGRRSVNVYVYNE